MLRKHAIKLLIAAIALTPAAALLAQDAPKQEEGKFKFSGAAYSYGAMFNRITKDTSSSYGALRIRPYFSFLTDNVEATVKLEIDQVFGGGVAGQADVGNDEKGIIEVKAAYLKFKLPAVSGLTLKAGADEYKTVGGFVCGTELAHGLINYKTDMFDVTLLAGKVWAPTIVDVKNDPASEKDDISFYAADATINMGDIKIRPALYVTTFGKNQVAATSKFKPVDTTAFIPSLGVSAKFGDFNVDVNGSYGIAKKDKSAVPTSYSGYAIDVNPSMKMGDVKVGVFATMISGDKSSTTEKNEGFTSFELKYDGFGRMYLLERKMTFDNIDAGDDFADVRKKDQGYVLGGANASYKLGAVQFTLAGAWAQLAHKNAQGEKALGIEIDGQIAYEIEKNAKIILEGAYLASGKSWETPTVKKQNAYYTGLGLSYKW